MAAAGGEGRERVTPAAGRIVVKTLMSESQREPPDRGEGCIAAQIALALPATGMEAIAVELDGKAFRFETDVNPDPADRRHEQQLARSVAEAGHLEHVEQPPDLQLTLTPRIEETDEFRDFLAPGRAGVICEGARQVGGRHESSPDRCDGWFSAPIAGQERPTRDDCVRCVNDRQAVDPTGAWKSGNAMHDQPGA